MRRNIMLSALKAGFIFVFIFVLFGAVPVVKAELDIGTLSSEDITRVQAVLNKVDPVILERDKAHTLATLTFDDLYHPLTKSERRFLKQFLHLDPKKVGVKIPYRGIATGKEKLVKVVGQKVKVLPREKEKFKTDARELPAQFVPPEIYESFTLMMNAMQKDIGKRLSIESGYRSSAYQLYLLLFYLKKHDYSIKETAKFVALPGFSEHGSVQHQALDFINADGINGEDNVKEFDELPEFAWLQKHAGDFGFVLSYPKDSTSGITYEPWHWRYEKP